MLKLPEIIKKYGEPGESKQSILYLPYEMKLSWDEKIRINKIRCHELIKPNLDKVFIQLMKYYGLAGIEELGIDMFGGCYNFRKMRGGSQLSRHSWGIAIDLNPTMNQLRWDKEKAQFALPEFKRMMEIFYDNGFINYGIEKNYDYMHFEIGQ